MQGLLKKLISFNKNTNLNPRKRIRKSRGQSLVEFAIAFPIIILLFSGVVEFGFALNYYLSLLDATRYAARWGSANGDPFLSGYNTATNVPFYQAVTGLVVANLDPTVTNPGYQGRRLPLDPALDDVIITVYGSSGGSAAEFPVEGPYRLYNNGGDPLFNEERIESRLVSGSPNEGILVVEVLYNYHQVLGLPWLAPFVPDPLVLRAYTIMPLSPAEPP